MRGKPEGEGLAVFFIGNSYSFGVPEEFWKVAEAHGKQVRIGHSTFGGWTLERHSTHSPTLKKLREGKWDIVVIQEYSRTPALGERERRRLMDGAVEFFVKEARGIGAVPVLYQTWGRRDGDAEVPGDDFLKMNARVRKGYESAAARAGGIAIVPAGDAWEREFRAGFGKELYVEDGSHPSDYGNRVTAGAFYKTFFGE